MNPFLKVLGFCLPLQIILSQSASGSCLTLIHGPVVLDVQQCTQVDPSKFDTSKPNNAFIKDLDPAGRKQFEDSYRGLLFKGKVVQSEAIQAKISKNKGALMGQAIDAFLPPSALNCQQYQGKRVATVIDEVCCNGTGDAPCLLDTGYVLKEVKVLGDAGAGVGDAKKKKAVSGPEYLAGQKFYHEKKYKEAAASYEKAFAKKEMDVTGLFQLANSYYHTDLCPKAIKPLKEVYQMQQDGKVWTDDETKARAGVFLLARCYSKMNDPQNAVFYLNGFLLEPKKYRAELQLALKHKDFGWIHTSREYMDFKKEAEIRLGKK